MVYVNRKDWLDCNDLQTDLSLCSLSKGRFCHDVTHICKQLTVLEINFFLPVVSICYPV